MVDAQHRLLAEGLGLKHVRLIIGNSMGGMHAWLWGAKYPDYMDALVPMVSQPTEMASRNWMMRRLMIETIKQDPGYNNGDYAEQPKSMKLAAVFYATGTNGGDLTYQKLAPTRASSSTSASRRRSPPTPTTTSMPGNPRPPTTRRRASTRSRRRSLPSTPPTTSATRRRPASPRRR
jgi:homoserine acetyltransferase